MQVVGGFLIFIQLAIFLLTMLDKHLKIRIILLRETQDFRFRR